MINLVHDLDTLRFLCGEITQVYAQARSEVRKLEVEDALSISLSFRNGMLGTILASDACPSPWSYESTTHENPHFFHADESCYHLLGTNGALAFPAMELWRYADEGMKGWAHPLDCERVEVETSDPLQKQIEHFCNVIMGKETSVLDAENGAKSLAVALAVQKSSLQGVPIDPATL